MNNVGCFDSAIGRIVVEDNGKAVVRIYIDNDFSVSDNESSLFCTVKNQLFEYFNGERKAFDIPISPEGTLFQQAVWNELCKIPYGKTVTYKDIAKAVGKPKAARAVGNANHNNPIIIVIPCHRVIGSNGSLAGYAYGMEVKQKLLDIENL